MPKLTQVKETKRGRYALFFDGEFAFSLDEDTFAMAGLHTGDELEEWQIHDLQTKSDTRKAVDKAMDLLALRDHAAGELYQKLCRSFDTHSAAAAVAKMQELNLLDDAGFARRRAAELLRKRKSRRAILDDLHAKGIDRGAAAEAVVWCIATPMLAAESAATSRALKQTTFHREADCVCRTMALSSCASVIGGMRSWLRADGSLRCIFPHSFP